MLKNRLRSFPSCVLLFCAAFFFHAAQAQDRHKIDSLAAELSKAEWHSQVKHESADTVIVYLIFSLSREYWSSSEDTGMMLGTKMLSWSARLHYKTGYCLAYRSMGFAKSYHANFAAAIDYFLRSLSIAEEIGDSMLICGCNNYLGLVYNNKGDPGRALSYLQKAIRIGEHGKFKKLLPNILNNIGNSYNILHEYPQAMQCYQRAYILAGDNGDKRLVSVCLMGIGEIYTLEKKYSDALEIHLRGLALAYEVKDKNTIGHCLKYVGIDYMKLREPRKAMSYLVQAMDLAREINARDIQKEVYQPLIEIYAGMKDFKRAFECEVRCNSINDSLHSSVQGAKIAQLQVQYEREKKQARNNEEQEKREATLREELNRQTYMRNGFTAGFATVLVFSVIVWRQKQKISRARKRSEALLENILPPDIAAELKEKGTSDAKNYESVTVMFTDFVHFTRISEQLSSEELVSELSYCFSGFDKIIRQYRVEKIKTIGDAYMCAGGVPRKNATHAADVVNAGIAIRDFLLARKKEKEARGETSFEARIGIHTGPVVAGIVGAKKFAYDIWGETVTLAARVENAGDAGMVTISENTRRCIEDDFICKPAGKISTRVKGDMVTHTVERKHNN